MDAIIATALQEIAAEGSQGCSLVTLWKCLENVTTAAGLHLDKHVKQAIWQAVLRVPGLIFALPGCEPVCPTKMEYSVVDNVERQGLCIVGSEELRDSYLGLYDLKHGDTRLSTEQRRILEIVAKSRGDGVTQARLSKETGIPNKTIFYQLKSMETRGLLIRHSTLVRNELGTPTQTNLVHLKRYAKDVKLGSQQRYEIRESIKSKNSLGSLSSESPCREQVIDVGGASPGEEIRIDDDLPALKTICDKLEEAEGKVCVVADLKVRLGYRLVHGHRLWRRHLGKLKTAGLVEVFDAEVQKKVVPCIRLLKPMDARALNANEIEPEQQVKGVRRGQVTEQLAELSIGCQIYDSITRQGQDGLVITEMWKRLGLNKKRNYYRLSDMVTKHGIYLDAVNQRKQTLYRARGPCSLDQRKIKGNEVLEEPTGDERRLLSGGEQRVSDKQQRTPSRTMDRALLQGQDDDERTVAAEDNNEDEGNDGNNGEGVESQSNLELVPYRDRHSDDHSSSKQLSTPREGLPASINPGQRYPLSTAHMQREIWIMEKLKKEKMMLRIELHKWLEEMEGRTDTMLDRKTVIRNLRKLQEEGQCNCILVSAPGTANYGRIRTTEVVLLSSVEVNSEVMSKIHERVRQVETQQRALSSVRVKRPRDNLPVLSSLKRTPLRLPTINDHVASLQTNGFLSAKIVRTRLLHQFLWEYGKSLSESGSHVRSPEASDSALTTSGSNTAESGGETISLLSAVKTMPLELFLQVIGSPKQIEGLAESCKCGVRLNDLSAQEIEVLLDVNASGRLSYLVDILRRLKLLKMVMLPGTIDEHGVPQITLVYALEDRPYIEEPPLEPGTSFGSDIFNIGPHIRHDFHLATKEDVEHYWQSLEYFFSGPVSDKAKRVFPGSTVTELFGQRSWTSTRLMSLEQRTELFKRVGVDDGRRLSYKECVAIAQELGLRMEQVLRVSYEKNQKIRMKALWKEYMDSSDPSCIKMGLNPEKAQKLMSRKKRGAESEGFIALKVRNKRVEQEPDSFNCQESTAQAAEQIPIDSNKLDNLLSGEDIADEPESGFVNHISVVKKLYPIRSIRFMWAEASERMLIITYAKERAVLGARYNRVDWNSMELPAPPNACKRRIAMLKTDLTFRRAITHLCSVLAARYVKYLRSQPLKILDSDTSRQDTIEDYAWDDVEDPVVSGAIEECMKCIQLSRAKKGQHDQSMNIFSQFPPTQFESANFPLETNPVNIADAMDEEVPGDTSGQTIPLINNNSTTAVMKSSRLSSGSGAIRVNRLRKLKRMKRPASLKDVDTEDIAKDLGIATAAELIKLVFLNSSVETEVPQVLVDALHRCKEADVFRAFKFLKNKDLVAIGRDSRVFVLSSRFYNNISSSIFPQTTSDESLRLEAWLSDKAEELKHGKVAFKAEIQCGEMFRLFGLISSGRFSLLPSLPKDGIGEHEESSSTCRKRKAERVDHSDELQSVKALRALGHDEGGYGLRRERGFPNLPILAHHSTLSLAEILSFPSDRKEKSVLSYENEACLSSGTTDGGIPRTSGQHKNLAMVRSNPLITTDLSFFEKLPGLQEVYQFLLMSKEDGLRVNELSGLVDMQKVVGGEAISERYADALEVLGLARKILAYDHVRVVAMSYCQRYLLKFPVPVEGSKSDLHGEVGSAEARRERKNNSNKDGMEENKVQFVHVHLEKGAENLSGGSDEFETVPILPWLSGDGKENTGAKRALTRRVLGIVMLNPGIPEEALIQKLDILNPMTARRLLEVLELDGHLEVRMRMEKTSTSPLLLNPFIFQNSGQQKYICRRHYYGNRHSTSLL